MLGKDMRQLARAMAQGGEFAASSLLARTPARSHDLRRPALLLYTLCEHQDWADDARGYNELVTAWYALESASRDAEQLDAQSVMDI